jgi:heat shock protein HspQ
MQEAKFSIGQVVKPQAVSIPRRRIRRRSGVFEHRGMDASDPGTGATGPKQPFYHLFAENSDSHYVAYVSEQNLIPTTAANPSSTPRSICLFDETDDGEYKLRPEALN